MNQIERDLFALLDMQHKIRDEAIGSLSDDVTDVAAFLDLFHTLDALLKQNLTLLSDQQINDKKIDRGGWEMPLVANVHTYREALLIVLAKLDIYLRALQKPLPGDWAGWIG